MPTVPRDKVGLGLVLDADLHQRLVDAAKKDHRSLQSFVTVAITQRIEQVQRGRKRRTEKTWAPQGVWGDET